MKQSVCQSQKPGLSVKNACDAIINAKISLGIFRSGRVETTLVSARSKNRRLFSGMPFFEAETESSRVGDDCMSAGVKCCCG